MNFSEELLYTHERYVWNMFECKECSFKIGLVELFSSFFNLEYN